MGKDPTTAGVMNRLANNNKEGPAAMAPPAAENSINIGQHGATARMEDGTVIVVNRDQTELFRFDSRACPFAEQPIRFLVEIYAVGFNKGKLLGREMVKQRIYELLGPEL
jgi:hypothetical protein